MLRAFPRGLTLIAAAALLAVFVAEPAQAERRGGRGGHTEDLDATREGVRNGRLLSLGEVLRRIEREYPGRMLDASLQEYGGRPAYLVIWLTRGGRRLSIWADARTGNILRVDG
ncbi:MAG: hypothetical protein U1E87_09705 [Alphaproteobacteria bacterium]